MAWSSNHTDILIIVEVGRKSENPSSTPISSGGVEGDNLPREKRMRMTRRSHDRAKMWCHPLAASRLPCGRSVRVLAARDARLLDRAIAEIENLGKLTLKATNLINAPWFLSIKHWHRCIYRQPILPGCPDNLSVTWDGEARESSELQASVRAHKDTVFGKFLRSTDFIFRNQIEVYQY